MGGIPDPLPPRYPPLVRGVLRLYPQTWLAEVGQDIKVVPVNVFAPDSVRPGIGRRSWRVTVGRARGQMEAGLREAALQVSNDLLISRWLSHWLGKGVQPGALGFEPA